MKRAMCSQRGEIIGQYRMSQFVHLLLGRDLCESWENKSLLKRHGREHSTVT